MHTPVADEKTGFSKNTIGNEKVILTCVIWIQIQWLVYGIGSKLPEKQAEIFEGLSLRRIKHLEKMCKSSGVQLLMIHIVQMETCHEDMTRIQGAEM